MSNTKNILVASVLAALLCIVILTACKEGRKSARGKNGTAVENRTEADAQTKANTRTFVSFKYTDPMTGMEAFRLLIPKGWQVEGRIAWSANPALPAQARFRFYSPAGTEEFNLFPAQSYFWTNNQMALSTNPPGSLRFGTLVMSPVDLHTALTKVVIPQARAGVSSLKIVEEKEVPELAKLARGQQVQGVRSYADGGKMRIQYLEEGRTMEEEIYAVVSQFITDLPGSAFTPPYFINYWYIDYVFSFKAEKNSLDSQARVFQTMVYSLKVNPRWFAKVANVREMMAQNIIRGIKAIGRIGDMVARAGSDMREDQLRDWERRQQANDRIVQNFTDNIRGVERFHDPFADKEVELPSGYGRAFANNLGEYIVTDSPSYNPNIGSNLHWEELTPAK
ncbi:MAG: hypothetical protein AB1442_05845 [Nitrospirota bacterium]